jgi:hypothetical protein
MRRAWSQCYTASCLRCRITRQPHIRLGPGPWMPRILRAPKAIGINDVSLLPALHCVERSTKWNTRTPSTRCSADAIGAAITDTFAGPRTCCSAAPLSSASWGGRLSRRLHTLARRRASLVPRQKRLPAHCGSRLRPSRRLHRTARRRASLLSLPTRAASTATGHGGVSARRRVNGAVLLPVSGVSAPHGDRSSERAQPISPAVDSPCISRADGVCNGYVTSLAWVECASMASPLPAHGTYRTRVNTAQQNKALQLTSARVRRGH